MQHQLPSPIQIKSADFVISAVKPAQYPHPLHPEVAFAGRSNVGKSSLINTLVNRKRLVKTSSTPGRTQLINFFLVNKSIFLVDLPGFGYAKVPISVRKKWGPMVETYLSGRANLMAVVLLMDVRRMPGTEEFNLIHWLHHYTIPIIVVLTKADKLSKIKQHKQLVTIAALLGMNAKELILFSAKNHQGKVDLWRKIQHAITQEDEK